MSYVSFSLCNWFVYDFVGFLPAIVFLSCSLRVFFLCLPMTSILFALFIIITVAVCPLSFSFSSTNQSTSSCQIELGANWIHGLTDENPCYRLAKSNGFSVHPTSGDDEPGIDDVCLLDPDFGRDDTHNAPTEREEAFKYSTTAAASLGFGTGVPVQWSTDSSQTVPRGLLAGTAYRKIRERYLWMREWIDREDESGRLAADLSVQAAFE